MEAKVELHRAYMRLRQAASSEDRKQAAVEMARLAQQFADTAVDPELPDPAGAMKRDAVALEAAGSVLDTLDDADLRVFNQTLPWGAITVDRRGRTVGASWSASKRSIFNALIDRRLIDFDKAAPLAGKHVLEVGCFEGIHTLGCLLLGARVTGVDGRIENILKTMARLWAYDRHASLVHWDLEKAPPRTVPPEWDVLHHIGVLYHLSDPAGHLDTVLPRTKHAMILDTHVARDDSDASRSYAVNGRTYTYKHFTEDQVDSNPFAGLGDHAKWLRVEDLMDICRRHGFSDVRLTDDRSERNGRRVMIWAMR